MSLTVWNPFREMERMMDRYVGRGPTKAEGGREAMALADWSPSVDISETDEEYVIKVELPEVRREDVRVAVNQGVLTIEGERKIEREEKGKKYHRIERAYGSFARSFTLPEDVEADGIQARHKDGMLYLHLAKSERAKPRSVAIKID